MNAVKIHSDGRGLNSISSPIFTRGFREKLNFDDLPSLPAILKVHSLTETFRWRLLMIMMGILSGCSKSTSMKRQSLFMESPINHICNLLSFPATSFRRRQCSSTKSGLTRLLLACFGSRLLQGLLLRLTYNTYMYFTYTYI